MDDVRWCIELLTQFSQLLVEFPILNGPYLAVLCFKDVVLSIVDYFFSRMNLCRSCDKQQCSKTECKPLFAFLKFFHGIYLSFF
ncbi:hypothetical protein ACFLZQ_02280 [Thermodesulfobacteriota bacterium]